MKRMNIDVTDVSLGTVLGTTLAVAIRVGWDKLRSNGHMTKAEFLDWKQETVEYRKDQDSKIDRVVKSVSTIEGWIRGRLGDPPS